jgi:hypothetical protein
VASVTYSTCLLTGLETLSLSSFCAFSLEWQRRRIFVCLFFAQLVERELIRKELPATLSLVVHKQGIKHILIAP